MTDRAGLTLLELLIALALMSLVAVGLAGTMRIGIGVLERSDRLIDNQSELALRGHLRRYIMQMSPPTVGEQALGSFEAEQDRLKFVTLAETPFAPSAAFLTVELNAQRGSVVVQIVSLNDDGQQLDSWTEALGEIGELSIRYLDDQGVWRNQWSEGNKLPLLVDIQVAGSRSWPPLTVAPRLR